jgi:RND family efflux transporter MFP subunit
MPSIVQSLPARGRAMALLLGALALAGCDSKAVERAAGTIRPVLVTQVHYESALPERTFVATIRPRIESDHGFRITGKVARRLVEVGDVVMAGQQLAILDDTDLQLQVEQAEAERQAATGAVTQSSGAERRATELRRRGFATDAAVDTAAAQGDEARGRLTRAERALELARNSLSYATLRADGAGVVTATMIEPGQVVTAGQAAIRLARTGEKEAVVAIPESLVERARTGQASVTVWSSPDRRYVARLRELAPAADAATRTYLARFSLPDIGEATQLGMTATLTLADATAERVARLPLSALFSQGAGSALYVVDDKTGSLALKPVTVKAYEARDVLVTGGVEDGESVVALGVQKLDPAQKVRVVQALAF